MIKTTVAVLVLACCVGCGSDEDDSFSSLETGGQGPSLGGSVGMAGSGVALSGGTRGDLNTTGGSGGGNFTLPADFTKADMGGWKLGGSSMDAPPPMSPEGCNNTLTGIIRDFDAQPTGHPDFEMQLEDFDLFEGLVKAELGAEQKPVYAPSGATPFSNGVAAFDQWYRTEPGVNQPFYLTLFLVPAKAANTFTFESKAFFPLDGAGFGNFEVECEGSERNFHSTFELHTAFRYRGGETFTFIGDDDVFIFINGRLALDIGGVHPEVTETIDLDARAGELGIAPGSTYSLDMFHAERHVCGSNFRVDTTLEFTNCGVFVPEVPR